MLTKQLTIFIENRKGRLGEVLDVLKGGEVNILSTSLADTTEYGLLRILADKPQKGKEVLVAAGFSAMLTDVFILRIPHTPGGLQEVLQVIAKEELDVEYTYGLSADSEGACIVVKTSNQEKADEIFTRRGIQTLSYEELK